MSALPSPDSDDPAAFVADFEARAQRFETPCGEGVVVWRAWGQGAPVLLLHGSHGSWSHWIRNIDALLPGHTVWAVDLPGCGESAMPPTEDHRAFADVLATGIRALIATAGAIDVVGFSFGGVLAAHLALFYPELVRRLVLVGTGGLATPKGELDLCRVRGLEGEERRAAHRHNLLGLMLHHPETVDELALYLQELNGMRGRINASHLVLPDRLLVALHKVRCQVDVIWGELDRPHPNPSVQEAAVREIQPDVDFAVVEGAGHWVMYERPEAFNRALQELLSRPLRAGDLS